jgi:hypothetical protein
MRQYITISINVDSGEADFTPASQQLIAEMVERAGVWDFDILQDIYHISRNAFYEMRENYDFDFKENDQ